MAGALVEFVKARHRQANPIVNFTNRADLPEGFGVIQIVSGESEWLCSEGGVTTLNEIYEQIGLRISDKNKLYPTYRSRLPNSPIWLLAYSGVAVSRGVPTPAGLSERTFPFDFDRVLFFSALDTQVVEISRSCGTIAD
jgi:hypothetical protein